MPFTSTLVPTGSLVPLMDNLVALEETVHPDLIVYRWRPREFPQLDSGGAIYNWIGADTFQVFDVAHWKDIVQIVVRAGIRHTDVNDEMAQIEVYADAFRDVIDGALWRNQPLGGAAKKGARTGMRLTEDTFNTIPVLAIEFTLEFELLRTIPAR